MNTKIAQISASLIAPLDDFLADPKSILEAGGNAAVAVLDNNRPCFYVLSPQGWSEVQRQVVFDPTGARPGKVVADLSSPHTFDQFESLAHELLQVEMQRMERGDLSRAAVGILRNRLDAHVMPFFRDIRPSEVDVAVMEAFVERLTEAGFSTTTMSQYLVVVRKLLRLAVRHKLLREVPEMPKVRVVHRPRAMLTLADYVAVVRAAHRLVRQRTQAPQVKQQGRVRERFWVGASASDIASRHGLGDPLHGQQLHPPR